VVCFFVGIVSNLSDLVFGWKMFSLFAFRCSLFAGFGWGRAGFAIPLPGLPVSTRSLFAFCYSPALASGKSRHGEAYPGAFVC